MMLELTAVSQEDLVSELLAPPWLGPGPSLHCSECHGGAASPRPEVLARRLAIARELLLRQNEAELRAAPVIDKPERVREWARLHFAGTEHESFVVLMLDARNRLIVVEEMFRGTLTQTAVYPREVVKAALAANAAAVLLLHNHPSGAAIASRADELLTQTLKSALALVDVRVLDHLVVGHDAVSSFAERGLL